MLNTLLSLGYGVLSVDELHPFLCPESIVDCDVVVDGFSSISISDNIIMYARLGIPAVILSSIDDVLSTLIDSESYPDAKIVFLCENWSSCDIDMAIKFVCSTGKSGLFPKSEVL